VLRVFNVTRSAELASRAGKATGPVSRGIGLMGRSGLETDGGLIIEPCKSVTTFFMRFPIDVLFVDRQNRVCHLIPRMRPWRGSRFVREARFVIELPAGSAERTGTAIGDELSIEAADSGQPA